MFSVVHESLVSVLSAFHLGTQEFRYLLAICIVDTFRLSQASLNCFQRQNSVFISFPLPLILPKI